MSVHEETGAYVLDALTPAERTAFEAHLESCPECAREVRDFAATAALLARAVAVEPPPELREAVLGRIRAEGAPDPGTAQSGTPSQLSPPARRPWLRWALAACLAAAAGLGGVAAWQYQRADDARQSAHRAQAGAEALTAVLTAPDARLVSGRAADGATGTVILSRDRDRAVFVASGMPRRLPGGSTRCGSPTRRVPCARRGCWIRSGLALRRCWPVPWARPPGSGSPWNRRADRRRRRRGR